MKSGSQGKGFATFNVTVGGVCHVSESCRVMLVQETWGRGQRIRTANWFAEGAEDVDLAPHLRSHGPGCASRSWMSIKPPGELLKVFMPKLQTRSYESKYHVSSDLKTTEKQWTCGTVKQIRKPGWVIENPCGRPRGRACRLMKEHPEEEVEQRETNVPNCETNNSEGRTSNWNVSENNWGRDYPRLDHVEWTVQLLNCRFKQQCGDL